MASAAQIAANRCNAAGSTGPKSEKGKARSSRNAEKYGLFADEAVIEGEIPAEFIELLESYQERFQPVGALEEDLVSQLAAAQWRLGRAMRLETAFFDHTVDEERDRWRKNYEAEPATDQDRRYLVGGALVRDAGKADTLSKISRYEMRLTHRYNRALARLAWLQDERIRSTIPDSPPQM
jgi:hypothetical protein